MIVVVGLLLTGLVDAQPLRPVPSHAAPPSSPPPVVAARVNGVAISGVRLAVAVDALLPGAAFHGRVSGATRNEVAARALEGLINEELWVQEARRRGVAVTAAEIDAGLARARSRYRGPGTFDEARRRAGARLADVRESIARALLVEKAHAAWVTARCVVGVSDAARYFAENPDRFVTPPRRRVSIITISVDPAASVAVRQSARARITDLARRLRDGGSFEALAREYSTDPSRERGGDLGLMHSGQLLEDFETALDRLAVGATTDVVQTIYGYHLLRLAANEPPVRKSFDDVRDALVSSLTKARCDARATELTTSLRRKARIEIPPDPARRAAARP